MDPASGETDLTILLANLEPVLSARRYVFHLGGEDLGGPQPPVPWATICEEEGTTYILDTDQADSIGLAYRDQWARITLHIHSSLHAVGLTAAVSGVLATNGISANMVAGYFHDHLFIPFAHAARALGLLKQLGECTNTGREDSNHG